MSSDSVFIIGILLILAFFGFMVLSYPNSMEYKIKKEKLEYYEKLNQKDIK